MRFFTLPLAVFLASTSLAQTSGAVGTNDLTINGLGSSAMSCAAFCFPNGGLPLAMVVSAPPGSFAIAAFSFCPCMPCFLPGPANACLPPIPPSACGGSNQSLDLNLGPGCGIAMTAVMPPGAAGLPSLVVPIPILVGPPCAVATMSVQAVVFNPGCGLGLFAFPGPLVMTQAFTLRF